MKKILIIITMLLSATLIVNGQSTNILPMLGKNETQLTLNLQYRRAAVAAVEVFNVHNNFEIGLFAGKSIPIMAAEEITTFNRYGVQVGASLFPVLDRIHSVANARLELDSDKGKPYYQLSTGLAFIVDTGERGCECGLSGLSLELVYMNEYGVGRFYWEAGLDGRYRQLVVGVRANRYGRFRIGYSF